jgi:hypothetical protein
MNAVTKVKGLVDFLVALAAATLAVLPLRVVLVPSSIDVLTVIDAVLGFGAVSLVSLGLVAYGRDLRRDRRASP